MEETTTEADFCMEHCVTEDHVTMCRTICASDSFKNLKLVDDVKVTNNFKLLEATQIIF